MINTMSHIGFFQLSNLVRNKVPFALYALDLTLPQKLQGPLSQMMQGVQFFASENFIENLLKIDLKLNHPIVLLCQNGKLSESMAEKLSELGYINVYSIKDGWENLSKDG